MKTAIITGATGFIGSNLTKTLVQEGWKVGIIARASSSLKSLGSVKNIVKLFRVYDEPNNFTRLVNFFNQINPTVVFHLAAKVQTKHSYKDIRQLIESNITFGTNVLEAMNLTKTRHFINTGSYWQHFKNEEYNPVCLYAATKEAFEKIIEFYVKGHNFKAITLELFDTYGKNDKRGKIVSSLIEGAKNKEVLKLTPGKQKMDLVHINDVVNAYLNAAAMFNEINIQEHKKFTVNSGESITLLQLVELIEDLLDDSLNIEWGARQYRKRQIMEPMPFHQRLPGWKPSIPLAEGLSSLINEK